MDDEEESFVAGQLEKESPFDDISSYCTWVVVKASKSPVVGAVKDEEEIESKVAIVDLPKSPSTSFPLNRAPSSIGGRSGAEGREKESATSST